MNNLSQPPEPAEPDMVLLFLGSFLEDLLHAPARDDAKLDALAMADPRRRSEDAAWIGYQGPRGEVASVGICGC
jgi:hypothetical protein